MARRGPGQSLDETLRSAIHDKRLLSVRYTGSTRVVEPHDYGVHHGTEKLLVYQLQGPARLAQKSVIGWRLLEVARIEECVIRDETFRGSRGESNQRHHNWEVLYARVK